jgi:putative alpha-1,2-mannosidase
LINKTKIVTGIILLCFITLIPKIYSQSAKEPADYVNPYIGSISPKTGGTSPEVYLPHGMIELAPQFTPGIGDEYLANKIFDFSLGGLSIMATTGDVKAEREKDASAFDHDFETATPYYYSALLEDYNTQVEFTLTNQAVIYRFTFPQNDQSNILVRLFRNGNVELKGDNVIEGYISQDNWKVYFYMEFNRSVNSSGTWEGNAVDKGNKKQSGRSTGLFVSYATSKNDQVLVKISASTKSIDDAKETLEKEIPGWNFEQVKSDAKAAWNNALSLIKIEGGTDEQLTTFYTALYRTMGRKGNVWDTHRCAYPLQTIIEPKETAKAIQSFVKEYEDTGWLTSSGAMIGNHAASVIADAYMKGIRDFDVEKAYAGMVKNATQATMIPWRDAGHITELEQCYFDKGYYPALPVRPDLNLNEQKPADQRMPYQIDWLPDVGVKEWVSEVDGWHRRQSVSVTLEHSYDDWCLAQMSKALGKDDDYKTFMKRAHNYINLFDTSIGFMAPKDASGKWVRPFNPKLSGSFAGEEYFAECNSWIYTFSVQHDVQGLINLMGGRDKFNAKLDQLFVEQYDRDKPAFIGQFPDMTGLIGMYCQGNEPAFHIPYLYNYSGQPWKTQKMVREIMNLWYNSGPFGLPGDDDGGAMSAWYVLSSIGFYSVSPGRPVYVIGSPLFKQVTLNVGDGKTFIITANNVSAQNKYIQSAILNGKALTKPWFEHSDMVNGGSLVFEMGPRPNKEWGSAIQDAPPSMSEPK